jgi:hypothetical protein
MQQQSRIGMLAARALKLQSNEYNFGACKEMQATTCYLVMKAKLFPNFPRVF